MTALHPSIARRVERYHRLYESRRPGDLMIVIRPRWVTKKNLFEYDFDRGGHLEMAADMLRSSRAMLDEAGDQDDDLIPWLIADFGIAIHHTFLMDMPVKFAEWTSWADHPLAGENGYARLDEIHYNPRNKWVVRIKEMLQYWKQHNDGACLMNTHLHYGPLDLANALRGNDLFLDFYDHPHEVARLLDVCVDTIIQMELEMREVCADQIEQIGMPFWGALAPRGALYVSEDVMDMSGPAISQEWGVPWTSRIRERFGTIAVHHHMLGRKVHGTLGQMVRRSVLQVTNDPNCPPAMQSARELYEESGDNVLMLDCSPEEVLASLDELRRVRAILICGTGEAEKARAVVDAVRSISNIQ